MSRGDRSAVRVSVIVPFHDSGRHLAELLESVAAQELSEPFEVILVDNRSTDNSRTIVGTFDKRLTMRVVDAPRVANGSYARNVGAAAANGALFLFLDSDDAVAPGYLAAMVEALRTQAFVTSRVECRTLNTDWVRRAHTCWHEQHLEVVYDFLPSTGGNVGIRREVFERIGGYSEDFDACQDTVFAWRIQLSGVPLIFVGDALYRYRYRDSLGGLFRQCRNWGRADAQLFSVFRQARMPGRPLRRGLAEWRGVVLAVIRVRSRGDIARVSTRLGYCVGRVIGSLRFRVLYL